MYKLTVTKLVPNENYEEEVKNYNERFRGYNPSKLEISDYPSRTRPEKSLEVELTDEEFTKVKRAVLEVT